MVSTPRGTPGTKSLTCTAPYRRPPGAGGGDQDVTSRKPVRSVNTRPPGVSPRLRRCRGCALRAATSGSLESASKGSGCPRPGSTCIKACAGPPACIAWNYRDDRAPMESTGLRRKPFEQFTLSETHTLLLRVIRGVGFGPAVCWEQVAAEPGFRRGPAFLWSMSLLLFWHQSSNGLFYFRGNGNALSWMWSVSLYSYHLVFCFVSLAE